MSNWKTNRKTIPSPEKIMCAPQNNSMVLSYTLKACMKYIMVTLACTAGMFVCAYPILKLCSSINTMLFLVIAVISSAVILVLSPVDSENRKLDKDEILIAKRSIKKIILILLGVLFILYFGLRKLSSYFSSGILLTASLQLPVIFCKIRKRLPNDKNMI